MFAIQVGNLFYTNKTSWSWTSNKYNATYWATHEEAQAVINYWNGKTFTDKSWLGIEVKDNAKVVEI